MTAEHMRVAILAELRIIEKALQIEGFTHNFKSLQELPSDTKAVKDLYKEYKNCWNLLLEVYPFWVKEKGSGNYTSLQNIGNYLGITKERIRQVTNVTTKKCKSPKFRKLLKECEYTMGIIESKPTYE